jgi:hypothetical protein
MQPGAQAGKKRHSTTLYHLEFGCPTVNVRCNMKSTNRVTIQVLREVINGVLDFIEKDLGMPEVELSKDYYWRIEDDMLYSMEDQPKQLGVGSLIDDWEFVLSASRRDQQLPADFIHVAPLLQAFAQLAPSYTSPPDTPKSGRNHGGGASYH